MLFNVGEATTLPPVAASYQTTVEPNGAVAPAVNVCIGLNSHSVISPTLVGESGKGLMVKVTAIRVKLGQLVVEFTDSA